MKHSIITFLFAVSLIVSGDTTDFAWQGDKLFNETSTQVTAGTPVPDFVALTLFSDLTGFITGGNQIDISHFSGATFHPFISPLDVAGPVPPSIAGDYFTKSFTGDGSFAGQTAYLLIHKGNGSIQVGDFIGFGSAGSIVNELDADGPGGDPPSTPQLFDGGIIVTNITVIPEPTIIAMFLIGILCTFGFGRYRRKS